jgi:hypothetical protein
MDYSAVEEHPDASPWASSPQHNRTSFEPPSSPSFAGAEHEQQEAHEQAFAPESEPYPSGENEGSHGPSTSESLSQDPPPQRPAAKDQQRQNPPPKRTRHDRPQYKLQAKITSVERNGRKDPILKFDVYVCCPVDVVVVSSADVRYRRPTSPSSVPHSTAMSAVLTVNSRSSQSILCRRIPKHSYQQSLLQ